MAMLRYATPDFVFSAFVIVKAYMMLIKTWERNMPMLLHAFVWLFAFLSYLLIMALWCTFSDLAYDSHFLDPDATAALVKKTMQKEGDSDVELLHWTKDASLETYPFLRWFSLSAPVWVVATFCVCLKHICSHALMMRKYQRPSKDGGAVSERYRLHDLTIRILLLPMVYGLMSLDGVIYSWGIVLNFPTEQHVFTGWKTRKSYYTEMFEAAFYVADIYESFSLLVLGHLIMKVIAAKVRKTQSLHASFTEEARAATLKSISATELMADLKELTIFGIKFFCWTCGLQAVYQLFCTTMAYYNIFDKIFALGDESGSTPGMLHTRGAEDKSHYFFLGAGFVASFAAIGNVVKVESAFHAHLREFGPFWKFWGTKVIVSIGFLQSMVLCVVPPFCWWSEVRLNLFYASLLCFECFLVSLLHLHAWAHDQSWYLGFSADDENESDVEEDPVLESQDGSGEEDETGESSKE